MKFDPVLMVFFGAGVAFLGRGAWDYFKSGRVEKGVYVTITDCTKVRDKCCIGQLKKDTATFETRLTTVEKRLEDGREDFRQIRDDIGKMKEHMAGMKSLLETWIDMEKTRQKSFSGG